MSTSRSTTHRWVTALVVLIAFVVVSFLLGIWFDEERWVHTGWLFVGVAAVPVIGLIVKYLDEDY